MSQLGHFRHFRCLGRCRLLPR